MIRSWESGSNGAACAPFVRVLEAVEQGVSSAVRDPVEQTAGEFAEASFEVRWWEIIDRVQLPLGVQPIAVLDVKVEHKFTSRQAFTKLTDQRRFERLSPLTVETECTEVRNDVGMFDTYYCT